MVYFGRSEDGVKLESHKWKKKASSLECESETQKKSEDELFFDVVGGNYIKSLETQVVKHVVKNDDQKKELHQIKQELDETKQGLVETQTNLTRTQNVSFKTKKLYLKPPNLS
ncbi:Centrin-4 [Bienertia sinuspersici]